MMLFVPICLVCSRIPGLEQSPGMLSISAAHNGDIRNTSACLLELNGNKL